MFNRGFATCFRVIFKRTTFNAIVLDYRFRFSDFNDNVDGSLDTSKEKLADDSDRELNLLKFYFVPSNISKNSILLFYFVVFRIYPCFG